MIIVISDLHLTDGTSGETINAGAFRTFAENLKRRVRDASWRPATDKTGETQGRFEAVDRCDVILLGDILDVIRSSQWVDSGDETMRPWGDLKAIAPMVLDITKKILAKNDESLAYLRELAQRPVTIRDDRSGKEFAVPVYFHYFVGNHDWFYHVKGPAYNETRKLIKDAMGLSNNPNQPFPHVLDEAPKALQGLIRAHGVYLQHGDIWDDQNFEKLHGRDHSSIGDCIVVELLNRFPGDVRAALNLDEQDPLFLLLKEIDNVRPLTAVPEWMFGVLNRLHQPDVKRRILKLWEDRVDEFFRVPFVKDHDKFLQKDFVDFLQVALRLTRFLGEHNFRRLAVGVEKIQDLTSRGTPYWKFAAQEIALDYDGINFVVYGHTHKPGVTPLDRIFEPGSIRVKADKIYINSGTWRRVHQRCEVSRRDFEFVGAHVMTTVTFYRGTERMGRRYETWTGLLD
ncbi:MAG: metallophosphoesterase [Deltaproteobacteria bacterium]|nr:metallophosphoesterase [Deltaproteobacteria bacterium]MCB9489203.1 metallophosphoesterase [Deltaproteobacteria bacterium]